MINEFGECYTKIVVIAGEGEVLPTHFFWRGGVMVGGWGGGSNY